MDKTLEQRLAWLAGVIDGEGSICMFLGRRKARKGTAAMFRIMVSNTDLNMIEEIVSIAKLLGVGSVLDIDRHRPESQFGRRRISSVTFDGKSRCASILLAVQPFLITKRAQATLMLTAIERRHARIGTGQREMSNDPDFLEYARQISSLNKGDLNG